jgi:hypothetical protein
MPWGHPDATEALYCVGCGAYGRAFAQRRFIEGPPPRRVRLCPPCAEAGWRLVGDSVEQGSFYIAGRHLRAVRVPAADEGAA